MKTAVVPFNATGVVDLVAAKKVDYVQALMGQADDIRRGVRSAAGPFDPAYR